VAFPQFLLGRIQLRDDTDDGASASSLLYSEKPAVPVARSTCLRIFLCEEPECLFCFLAWGGGRAEEEQKEKIKEIRFWKKCLTFVNCYM
jgi:hypothetical protein